MTVTAVDSFLLLYHNTAFIKYVRVSQKIRLCFTYFVSKLKTGGHHMSEFVIIVGSTWFSFCMWVMQDAALDFDSFQINVLMMWVEYKKQKTFRISLGKCHLIYVFYFLKITTPMWSSWHTLHSCSTDWKWTLTLQQTFISGANLKPGVLFHPLKCHIRMWWYSELVCN